MSKRITADNVKLKRAYEPSTADDGTRILIDRLWPRGVTKVDAAIDEWVKDIAPSTALRKWFGHDPARWREFRTRYAAEVNEHPEQLDSLRGPGKTRPDHARLLGSRRSSQRRRRTEELSFGTTDETRNQDGSPIRLNSRVGP